MCRMPPLNQMAFSPEQIVQHHAYVGDPLQQIPLSFVIWWGARQSVPPTSASALWPLHAVKATWALNVVLWRFISCHRLAPLVRLSSGCR
jgi:hypothetical protein